MMKHNTRKDNPDVFITKNFLKEQSKRFRILLDRGLLSSEEFFEAESASLGRGVDLETILIREYNIPRRAMLQALSEYYHCHYIEYDERMPIPPELLSGLDPDSLSMKKWFPVIKDGDTVIIAVNNPQDPEVLNEVKKMFDAERYEFWVALREDIQWFIQDFLHAKPGYLIGTERTGLAFWRNTMAQWRTRLACYRNDMAKARTSLACLRWGFGLIAILITLIRLHTTGALSFFYWIFIVAGFSFAFFGLSSYLKIRKSRIKPPEHQTLVEVTSATLHFLENYHFIENTGIKTETKKTMLARLDEFLLKHCTILYPSPASKERTHLARERNVLAGQRTVAACYRTIYARARTGLAFIRTGVSFSSFGLGLIKYFGFSLLTIFDSILVLVGILMIIDGALWYMPVRKEQAEIPRCPVPQ
jgi:uncharacterized membrane protein YidH (DUF202 family)